MESTSAAGGGCQAAGAACEGGQPSVPRRADHSAREAAQCVDVDMEAPQGYGSRAARLGGRPREAPEGGSYTGPQQGQAKDDHGMGGHEEEWWLSDGSDSDGSDLVVEHGQAGTAEDHERWLLDPKADDCDAAWVAKQRGGGESDAILNCPGCFTTVCVDCQKHASYENQWRAMFVINCEVSNRRYCGARQSSRPAEAGRKRQLLADEEEERPGAERDSGSGSGGNPVSTDERLVLCQVCDTELGVMDGDEVFHFFNVFPSNA
mmetsp:Transcript_32113/g.91056  ORF Transcript_32113/g.91056 Transcript_32113/m.91056 type:complete len:263 (-) Transcript_32113:159-947(-)